MGSGALAFLHFAAQCGVEVTEVKQQLQGSVLGHGEYALLQDGRTETHEANRDPKK